MLRLCIPVLSVLLFVTGCGHTHRFTPAPAVGTLASSPLSGKRLFLDLSHTPEAHQDHAGGHGFTMVGIRQHTEHVIRTLFKNETFVATPEEADLVLAPSLRFDLSTTVLGTRCTCTAGVEIRDRAGTPIATGNDVKETAFPTMANAGRNCEISALQSLSAALDIAFAALSAAPATTAPAPAPVATPSTGACTKDADCQGDLICTQGHCAVYSPSLAPATDAITCTKDTDCPGTQICELGRCSAPAPTTVACSTDAQCTGNTVCIQGGCAPRRNQGESCARTPVCTAPLICIVGTCDAPRGAGGACAADTDCKAGHVCYQGKCHPVATPTPAKTAPAPPPGCGKDTDCKGDRICENGKCVSPK